ncbi:MAG: hypothetical protein IJ723_07870, partial [Ruminococcus sp.]|nr:hypothetical protein [Ruminococcus sp.]
MANKLICIAALAAAAVCLCTSCGSTTEDESSASTETAAPQVSTDAASTEAAAPQVSTDSVSEYHIIDQPVKDSPDWVTALEATKDCEQLIVVAGVDKSTAYISMHEKNADGKWQQIISSPGYVGLEGLGEANCRQTITPVGTFTIDKAFGLADDPGCQMEYTKCDGDWYWSGDAREGMHFNELVNINDVPGLDPEECERIADYEYPYQYCLNMGWNSENDPEKGCAFFFHCQGVRTPYTGGCVSVNEPVMKFIMQHVKPGCRITIDTLENMGGE